MIKKYKNFIFDFDGTLVNSNRYHSISFQRALLYKKKKIKFNYEDLKGLKTEDAFKKIGIKKNISEFSKLKRDFYNDQIHKIKLYKNSLRTP